MRSMFALIVIVLVAGAVHAGPLEDAQAAYNKGDYTTALRLWRPLAEQGNAVAQSNLGVMYAGGQAVPKDYGKALEWFRLAAAQGNAAAQFNLGLMYYNGLGVPKDYDETLKWYRLAAEQGNAPAQSNLGLMYANGRGVPRDYVEAYKWVSLAVSNFPAGGDRDRALRNRDAVTGRMTREQLAEAQKRASEWKPTAQ
jgi:TPR repeat protein